MPVAEMEQPKVETAAAAPRLYVKTVLALAAAARLGVVWFAIFHDPKRHVFNMKLSNLAHSLLTGHGLSSPFGGSTGPTAFLAPGYPALVAGVFRLFGESSLASAVVLMLLQTAMALMTCWLIMRVAEKQFGAKAANISGSLWALGLPLLWLPSVLWETSLSTLLLLGLIRLALRCVERPDRTLWLVMGAYCGLTMLVNPSLTLAMLAILAWTGYKTRFVSRLNPCLALLVLAVVFSPWPIRNARTMHAFIPMRSNLGFELWEGNRPGADGFFDMKLDLEHNQREFDDYAAKGEVIYMRDKSTQAKAAIRSNPWRFVKLTTKRIACFWTGVESESNGIVIAHIAASSLLGLIGLLLLVRRKPGFALLLLLPLLIFPLPYYITHPDFRFREVLDPVMLMLAGYAIALYDDHLKSKHQLRSLKRIKG